MRSWFKDIVILSSFFLGVASAQTQCPNPDVVQSILSPRIMSDLEVIRREAQPVSPFDALFIWDTSRTKSGLIVARKRGADPVPMIENMKISRLRLLATTNTPLIQFSPPQSGAQGPFGGVPNGTEPTADAVSSGSPGTWGPPTTSINTLPPPTLSQYREILRNDGRSMSNAGKLALLSVLGEALGKCYDYTFPKGKVSEDQIFKNLQNQGNQGGVCRHINPLIASFAKDLGFVDVGSHTGAQRQPNGSDRAHAVGHFRDPETKEFWVANYNELVNTHQTRLDQAIDVSTKILGPLTSKSLVESRPGQTHLYEPSTARWLKSYVFDAAKPDIRPVAEVRVGNQERTVIAGLTRGDGKFRSRAFGIYSEHPSAQGDYRFAAAGVSGTARFDQRLSNSLFDEVALAMGGSLGILNLEAPKIQDEQGIEKDSSWSNTSGFIDLDVQGRARINQVTGFLEVRAYSLDMAADGWKNSEPWNRTSYVDVGGEWKPVAELVVSGKRRLQEKVVDMAHSATSWDVTYDEVSIVWDLKLKALKEGNPYVCFEGSCYALEGVEKKSATAVRSAIEAGLGIGGKTRTYIRGEHSGALNNHVDDPMYDFPDSWQLGTGAEAFIGKNLRTSLELLYQSGASPYHLFEEGKPGSIFPEPGDRKAGFHFVWTVGVSF